MEQNEESWGALAWRRKGRIEGAARKVGQLGRRKSKGVCVESSNGSGVLPPVSWMPEKDTNLMDPRQRGVYYSQLHNLRGAVQNESRESFVQKAGITCHPCPI